MPETQFFCRRGINLKHPQGPSFSPSPLPPKTFNSPVPELGTYRLSGEMSKWKAEVAENHIITIWHYQWVVKP